MLGFDSLTSFNILDKMSPFQRGMRAEISALTTKGFWLMFAMWTTSFFDVNTTRRKRGLAGS
jgi:hypothetical protein